MANILVVSGSYFPYATANAVCMKEFERELIAQGHTVTYVIRRHDIDVEEKTVQDGIEIYHIPRAVDEFYATCEKLKKVHRPQPLEVLFRSSLFIIKCIVTLYAKVCYGSVRNYSEKTYINNYAKKIEELVEEKKIDTIISVSMPFLSHKAVRKYKLSTTSKNVKWISYMIDAYSQKDGEKNVQKAIEEELLVMQEADKVVMLDVLRDSYDKEPFEKYRDKMVFLPLPLLKFKEDENRSDGIKKDASKKDCVFAGTLYDGSSSLEYFAKFVRELDSENFRFHFMGKIYPENKEILEKIKKEARSEIITYGIMPYAFAEASIEKADIVINIGNMNTNQIPSKVFQYISKKKMILNFYKIKDDPSLPLLEKYPLAYNLYEEDLLEVSQIRGFIEFYENNKNIQLDTEQLEMIYKGITSKDICKKFIDYL